MKYYYEKASDRYSFNYNKNLMYYHLTFGEKQRPIKFISSIIIKILEELCNSNYKVVIDYHYYDYQNELTSLCKKKNIPYIEHNFKYLSFNIGKRPTFVSLLPHQPSEVEDVVNILKNEDDIFIRIVNKNITILELSKIKNFKPNENSYISVMPKQFSRVIFLSLKPLDVEIVAEDMSPEKAEIIKNKIEKLCNE